MVRDSDDKLCKIRIVHTLWYLLYVKDSPKDEHMARLFSLRFWLPYNNFIALFNEMKDQKLFMRWQGSDCTGVAASDLNLLNLCLLGHLNRGFTFDNIEEGTAISRATHRSFMVQFLKYGSTVLYQKHIVAMEADYLNDVTDIVFKLS